jgi:hypothetical protein
VTDLLASVAAAVVLGTLLATGVAHLRHPESLAKALAAHGVLPAPGPVAVLVIAAELALGAGGCAALAVPAWSGARPAFLGGGAFLLALFTCYGWYVRSTGRAGSCGCSRTALPMTGWVVARAAVLTGLALTASTLAAHAGPVPGRPAESAVALLAAACFAVLLWQLPAAMYEPAAGHRPARTGGAHR